MKLFVAMGTQWRAGASGVIGLDYVALEMVCKATGIRPTAKRLDGLRVMECEALKHLAAKPNSSAAR